MEKLEYQKLGNFMVKMSVSAWGRVREAGRGYTEGRAAPAIHGHLSVEDHQQGGPWRQGGSFT